MDELKSINKDCKECQSTTLEKEDKIYDCICKIGFLVDNLECIRISVKGNEDVIPKPQVVDNALFSIIESMEPLVKEIIELL